MPPQFAGPCRRSVIPMAKKICGGEPRASFGAALRNREASQRFAVSTPGTVVSKLWLRSGRGPRLDGSSCCAPQGGCVRSPHVGATPDGLTKQAVSGCNLAVGGVYRRVVRVRRSARRAAGVFVSGRAFRLGMTGCGAGFGRWSDADFGMARAWFQGGRRGQDMVVTSQSVMFEQVLLNAAASVSIGCAGRARVLMGASG
jgi:hypothetical protein